MPAPGFRTSLHVSTEQGDAATVGVASPLLLHAARRTGPWRAVPRESLAPDACWLADPPPAHEPEVADNVRWRVEPPGAASFGLELREDRRREVRFSEPGVYRLTAVSAVWCGEPRESDGAVTVQVVGGRAGPRSGPAASGGEGP